MISGEMEEDIVAENSRIRLVFGRWKAVKRPDVERVRKGREALR